MVGFSEQQGEVGGTIGISPKELMNPVVWVEPWSQFMERELILGNLMPVRNLAEETYRFEKREPLSFESGRRNPPRIEPGGELPLFAIGEGIEDSGIVTSQGFKMRFDVRARNDPLKLEKGRAVMMDNHATWIERKIYEDITGDTVDADGKTTVAWASSTTDFSAFLGTRLAGGYATSGGVVDTILIGNNDGYYWNSDEGNAIFDWLRIGAMLKDQVRAKPTAEQKKGGYIKWNRGRTVVLLDSTSYTMLYAEILANRDFRSTVSFTDSEMRIPGIYGLTFRVANRALPLGTANMLGNSSGSGVALIYDETDIPFVGRQWFLKDRGPLFGRGGVNNGWDFEIYRNEIQDERGLMEVGITSSVNVALEYPKKFAIYAGFREGETV